MLKVFFSMLLCCLLNLGMSNSLLASSSDDFEDSTSFASSGSEKDAILIEEEGGKKDRLWSLIKDYDPKNVSYEMIRLLIDVETGGFNDTKCTKSILQDEETLLHEIDQTECLYFEYITRHLNKVWKLPSEDQCSIIFLKKHTLRISSIAHYFYLLEGTDCTYTFCLAKRSMKKYFNLSKKKRTKVAKKVSIERKKFTNKDRRRSGTVFDPFSSVAQTFDVLEKIYPTSEKKVQKFQKGIDEAKEKREKAQSKEAKKTNPREKTRNLSRGASSPNLSPDVFGKNEDLVAAFLQQIENENCPKTSRGDREGKKSRTKKTKHLKMHKKKKHRISTSSFEPIEDEKIKRPKTSRHGPDKKGRLSFVTSNGDDDIIKKPKVKKAPPKTGRAVSKKKKTVRRAKSTQNLREHLGKKES